eukprot:gene1302-1441_t
MEHGGYGEGADHQDFGHGAFGRDQVEENNGGGGNKEGNKAGNKEGNKSRNSRTKARVKKATT